MRRPTALAYAVAAEWALLTGRTETALDLIAKGKAGASGDFAALVSEAAILNAAGRLAEAEADLRLAMRLDPYPSPAALRALSVAVFEQRRYWEAIEIVGRIKAQDAASIDDYMTMVASLGQLGLSEGMGDAIQRYNRLALSAGREPMTCRRRNGCGLAKRRRRSFVR